MPERVEFYLRLAEDRMNMRNEQVALLVPAQIENDHQWAGRISGINVLDCRL